MAGVIGIEQEKSGSHSTLRWREVESSSLGPPATKTRDRALLVSGQIAGTIEGAGRGARGA
jgi:hypothetical protein